MAAVTSQATNSQDNPLVGFGPNEWIVEDMYQRYLADPSSVDPAWHDFFADYRPVHGRRTPDASAATDADRRRSRPPPRPPPRPHGRSGAAPHRRPRRRAAAHAGPPPRRRPGPAGARRRSTPAATTTAAPPSGRSRAATGARTTPIRGIAAKIVSNMDASLQVPDRDQRAGRAGQAARRQPHRDQQPPGPRPRRQGQLHPHHRVRAGQGARHAPGDEQLVRQRGRQAGHGHAPTHVNLGIAIDLAKPDGSRNLVVPSIKGADTHGLPAVLAVL